MKALRTRLKIDPFVGFGTSGSYDVAGRVSKDGGRLSSINAEFDRMGVITRVRRNLHRLFLPDVQGVALEVQVAGVRRETTTGPYGFFRVPFRDGPYLEPGTTTYSVRLHEAETRYEAARAAGQIVIPPADAPVGIVSDVDDTIVLSHVGNKLRLILHTLLTSVSDLKPTAGLAALYTAVAAGRGGTECNPAYYVSGSPARIHDKVIAFLRANRYPVGPIFLTAIGIGAGAGFFKQRIFKTERIRELSRTYPTMRFVLVGDNTEADSEIYHQIALEYPGRVAAALILERIPRIRSGKILPMGQYLIASALDGGLVLYRKRLISREGLRAVVNELTLAGELPDGFDLDRRLRQIERRERGYSTVTDLARFRG
jgi:phosphatidate phosphatase APP1